MFRNIAFTFIAMDQHLSVMLLKAVEKLIDFSSSFQ